ncbi:MAG TPA: phosphoribosyltransferase family protein [Acidimicrobiales bacterium]|jgi:predicted phosphoribosyltransferase|nr:phosphoribosyltransferase family protein [Acidimicrobiales bacterium]
MAVVFADRVDAGRRLAERLADLAGAEAVVLGLPRGGVPVAAEVAEALDAALDVLVVGKVGVPGHEELALAAVADDGHVAHNPGVISAVGLGDDEVDVLVRRHVAELADRADELRGGAAAEPVGDRIAILVDDGMATGATMRVAVDVVRGRRARELVVAVPVASPEACTAVDETADRVVCLSTPAFFRAVGTWYENFSQVPDAAVRELLAEARARRAGHSA